MFNLDFETSELQFPAHPLKELDAQRIKKAFELKGLQDHFLIFSSGTTSAELKGYAISRRALLLNAAAVNNHFELTQNDVWGLSIPHFHIGGLSVLARAHLLGSELVDLGKWNPSEWCQKIKDRKITITTVVPTQIHDLISLKLKSPQNLRYLVVGGDFLPKELELKAIDLGWPVIRTFGMTEVCSQLASAKKVGGELEVLPIHRIKVDENHRLFIKSQSLFSFEFLQRDELIVKKAQDFCDHEGFFRTNDLVDLTSGFKHLGRIDDQIKSAGKLVSFFSLKDKLAQYSLANGCYDEIEITLKDDERLGKKIVILHLESFKREAEVAELFLPLKIEFEKVSEFARTDLGKLKRI